MSPLRRRAFWAWLLTIAVVALGAVTAISYFAAKELLQHRSARPSVTPADSGLAYSVVPLKARDGTVLEGWWIRPRDGVRRRDLATVVLAHAADGERPGALTGKAGMLRHAAWLSRAGFIVLAFDFRSYGGSSGEQTTGGYLEQQDLEAAIRLAHERSVGAPVVVWGEGMGTMAAMAVMPRDSSLVALVADSPAKTWGDILRTSGPGWTSWALGPLTNKFLADEVTRGFEPGKSILKAGGGSGGRPVMLLGDRALRGMRRQPLTEDRDLPSHMARVAEYFESSIKQTARDSTITQPH
jgi:Serine aminopeptidase, S33